MSDATPPSPATPCLPVDEVDFDPRAYLNEGPNAPLLLLGIDGTHGERHRKLLAAASALLTERTHENLLETAVLETVDELRACLPAGREGDPVRTALAAAGWDVTDPASDLRFDDTSGRLLVFVRPRPETLACHDWKRELRGYARRLLRTMAGRAFPQLKQKLEKPIARQPVVTGVNEDVPLFAWTWPENAPLASLRTRQRGRRSSRSARKRARASSADDGDSDEVPEIVMHLPNDNQETRLTPRLKPRYATSAPPPFKRARTGHAHLFDDARVPTVTLRGQFDDPGVERVVLHICQTLRAEPTLPRFRLRMVDEAQPDQASLQEYMGRTETPVAPAVATEHAFTRTCASPQRPSPHAPSDARARPPLRLRLREYRDDA